MLAALLPIVWLSACDSIGDGSKLESLEIVPITGETLAGDEPYKVYECFRNGLLLRGTFSDGSVGNFTSRATWSSDSAKLRVANDGETFIGILNGVFDEIPTLQYARGTLIPVAPTADGELVTITAEFVGQPVEIKVRVRTPQLSVRVAPVLDLVVPPVSFIGVGTQQRLSLIASLDGRIVEANVPGSTDPVFNSTLNPVLWRFAGDDQVFEPDDADDAADFAFFRTPAAGDTVLTLTPAGTLKSERAEPAAEFSAQARIEPCAIEPAAVFKAADFVAFGDGDRGTPGDTTDDFLKLEREPGFSGTEFVFFNNELLKVTARLDSDYNGFSEASDATQDLSAVSAFDVTPKVTVGTTELNPDFLFSTSPGNLVQSTLVPTDGGIGNIRACFPDCADGTMKSNVLSLTAVKATLASIELTPASAAQPAFAFPGQPFDAVGTFTRDGLAPITQKMTRCMLWSDETPAADEAAETEDSPLLGLSNGLLSAGQTVYFDNPDASTDVSITAVQSGAAFCAALNLTTIETITPATLTVTRCSDTDCPP